MAVFRNPFVRFIALAVFLYAAWYALYEFWLKPASFLDEWMIRTIVSHARAVMGFWAAPLQEAASSSALDNWIALEGSPGVIVGAPCDGMVLFALFTIFILAYPGPSKHKVWFLPLGLILIHLVNVLRVIALVYVVKLAPDWLEFNHDYTFTILVYGFIFLLWYFWVNKFAPTAAGIQPKGDE